MTTSNTLRKNPYSREAHNAAVDREISAEEKRYRRNQKRMQDNKLYRASYFRAHALP